MFLTITIYFLLGLVFGIYFMLLGCSRLDPGAATAAILVRLLWLPAAIMLWPYLLYRLLVQDSI